MNFKMSQNHVKHKICCDELKQQIGKLPWLANLQTKVKPEASRIIVSSTVLSNGN